MYAEGHAGRGKGRKGHGGYDRRPDLAVRASWYPDVPAKRKGSGKGSSADSSAEGDPWSQWKSKEDTHRSDDSSWDTWSSQKWDKQASWWSAEGQWEAGGQWEATDEWRTNEWQKEEAEDVLQAKAAKNDYVSAAAPLTRHALNLHAKEFVPSSMHLSGASHIEAPQQQVVAESAAIASSSKPSTSPSTRDEMKLAAFAFFDTDNDGRLRSAELRKFAEQTGFEGSDDEWSNEYRLICDEMKRRMQDGLDIEAFSKLVDDDSDNGCYCADAELLAMVPTTTAFVDKPSSGTTRSEELHHMPSNRDEMKTAAFAYFDTDNDGRLRSEELRKFAAQTGFEGGDDEWSHEYRLICDEMKCRMQEGLDVGAFSKLVDDDSDNGCYCTDAELLAMIPQRPPQSVAVESSGKAISAVAAPPHPSLVEGHPKKAAPSTRPELKEAVFAHFDTDQDKRLRSEELRKFAEQTGFEGGDNEWRREYELICKDLNLAPSAGLAQKDFNSMVDDDSNEGCYCSDEELRAMLGLPNAGDEMDVVRRTEMNSPQPDTESRDYLKSSVFRLFDVDKDGRLKSDELNAFATKTGFDGNQEQWKWEYESLCQECGCNPRDGIGQSEFNALVDDESDNGCYSSNEELAEMLREASAQQPKHASANGSTSGKGKGKKGGRDDPLENKHDPWATPNAKRIHERQQNQQKKKAADEEKASAETWGQFTEAASKPALNVQQLLAASRSANAVRKAKEEEEKKIEELTRPPPPPTPASSGTTEATDGVITDYGYKKDPSKSTSSSSSSRVPRITTTAAALSAAGASIAQLAAGDKSAVSKLVNIVAGSPNSSHVLAVASTAMKLLFQNRIDDVRTLLGLQDLLMDPTAGEATILQGISDIARSFDCSAAPFLLKLMLPLLLKIDAKSSTVRCYAIEATQLIAGSVDAFAFEALMQPLLSALDSKRSPAVKLHALKLLGKCGKGEGEKVVAHKLPQLIPAVTALLTDVNHEVKVAASEYAEVLFALSGNKDLEPYGEDILNCSRGKRDVVRCVKDLAEVVFVQQFEAPALAVIMPVLLMGLKSRNMRTQRQASIIAENVCKLVPSIADVQPFAPDLLPLLKRVGEDTSDPDVRMVATRAHKSLACIADANRAGAVRERMRTVLTEAVSKAESDAKKGGDVFTPCPPSVSSVIIGYLVTLCVGFGNCNTLGFPAWKRSLKPHLEPLLGEGAEKSILDLLEMGKELSTCSDEHEGLVEDTEDPSECEANEILCDCNFTLACGASTLLKSAQLKLRRGCVYGLVGANDSGKSALLRAIHERKVVGFPNELLSAFVEHGVGEKSPECDWTPLEYLLADPTLKSMGMQKAHIVATLKNLGFGDRSNTTLKTLSGGWRMKLGLARAMLQEASVLLLDEPTGHLDTAHVGWLVDYITGLQTNTEDGVTTVIVSHNAAFLDRVCTHIIHAHDQKLTTYFGKFTSFMERVPDAQLGSVTGEEEKPLSTFVLPEPGALEGVRSQGKRFLHLENVSYSYPKASRRAVDGVTVECSLRSRVGMVGPNGAGKSTLAALLVGEVLPDSGNAWRHPNLRMAFVAQHTFHHLEQHLDLTATQYILWRFEGNEDREALDFLADEGESSETVRTYRFDDGNLVACDPEDEDTAEPESILDRRQRGRLGYEYEVKWLEARIGATWVPRWQLIAMGHIGMVRREDARQAAQQSLIDRPLTSPSVEIHLAGFGLDKEEASHRRLGALSNGQRARAVLGAATWLAPHLLVLDEPSNYLDPPALTALASGLQSFGGGVIVISHNHSFLDEVCNEQWIMDMGHLRNEKTISKMDEVVVDNVGIANAAAREAKEKKKQKRLRELRRKNGEDVGNDDDEWWEDLLKKTSGK